MKTQTTFFTFGLLSLITGCAHMKSEAPVDEYTTLSEESEESAEQSNSQDDWNLDAGEGMKAKSEEGRIQAVQVEALQERLSIASESAEFEAAAPPPPGVQPAPSMDAIDTLGTKGVQMGVGGLGTRGSGQGGGGLSGVIGAKGVQVTGSGASGYGKGSGSSGYGKKKKSAPSRTMPPQAVGVFDNDANIQVASPIMEEAPATVVASSEAYEDYGVNPFTQTVKDALSTFSIDVDTASYTISRRKLNEGTLPPMASVRAEEFINYVDYDYPSSDAQPFDVHIDGMVDPFRPEHQIVRVGVQAKELTASTRPPLHLTFLIDVSGSMSSQDKLPMAQQAMHLLVDTLQEGDSVALATYAGRVARILEPTSGTNKRAIHAAIDSLKSGGSTAMSSGIDIAYDMAWNSFEAGAENRVVVMSDGDANVGSTGWETMLSQIKGYADRGVTLSTIGLGMGNYKDTTMEQLANKGDGNNYYIDSLTEARKLFVEGFNSTMISIARDVKIQVELNPERVKSYRLIGYENRDIADKDFRNDRVDAGEVGAGHSVTALYELELTDGAFEQYGPSDLMTVRLRYESPGADKSATERAWTYTHSQLENARSNKSLRLAYTAGTFAEILRRSPYVSDISYEELADYARSAVRNGSTEDAELLSLIGKAAELSQIDTVVTR